MKTSSFTVRELIEQLSLCPDNAMVLLSHADMAAGTNVAYHIDDVKIIQQDCPITRQVVDPVNLTLEYKEVKVDRPTVLLISEGSC